MELEAGQREWYCIVSLSVVNGADYHSVRFWIGEELVHSWDGIQHIILDLYDLYRLVNLCHALAKPTPT